MRAASELLATADVDVIAWNGTSGSWLGPDHDRAIVREITAATGIPATTSTLAYFDAFERFGTGSIGLLTPYTPDVNEQVIARYRAEGIAVSGHRALGLSDNESFARVRPEALLDPSEELAGGGPRRARVLVHESVRSPGHGRGGADHRRRGAGFRGRHALALPRSRRGATAGPAVGAAARLTTCKE
ncbi:hypothetical protein [Arthrobacter woluwensis]|uniref:aspartate racemase/maleate isomerase family protein n=1 Tax=Arthrobacter woluwensis TaxID=156980 RepID=UPI001FB94787|nr:hypothetical protein [Arthrobacter woluwensis]